MSRPSGAGLRRERPSWGLREGDSIAEGRTVLRLLGSGARAEIVLVHDEHRAATAVAKLQRPHKALRAAVLKRLEREGRILDRLSHPSVVRGLDVATEGRYPHLLLEYVEGPTLGNVFHRHKPLPVEHVLALGRHLAGALAHLSERGVVHLDVKPSNIVMGTPPRFIDFGSALTVKRAERVAPRLRTTSYIAPERLASDHVQAQPGPHSDVWALGVVLYIALSGRRPFPRPGGTRHHPDLAVRCPQLVKDPQPLDGAVPPELGRLVQSMLARQPDARPKAAAVARALDPRSTTSWSWRHKQRARHHAGRT